MRFLLVFWSVEVVEVPCSLFWGILTDFNLSQELPKYRQYFTHPTGVVAVDHCYTVRRDAYCSGSHAAWDSDHSGVHLIPIYRYTKISNNCGIGYSPVKQEFKACFDCTDQTVFEALATDLDELRHCTIIHYFL